MCSYYFSSVRGAEWQPFWDIHVAAQSVDHMFSLYFEYLVFVILVISRFGFEGWIWVLIVDPDRCMLFTFISDYILISLYQCFLWTFAESM